MRGYEPYRINYEHFLSSLHHDGPLCHEAADRGDESHALISIHSPLSDVGEAQEEREKATTARRGMGLLAKATNM